MTQDPNTICKTKHIPLIIKFSFIYVKSPVMRSDRFLNVLISKFCINPMSPKKTINDVNLAIPCKIKLFL